MAETDLTNDSIALVKSQSLSLQRASSSLARRALRDIATLQERASQAFQCDVTPLSLFLQPLNRPMMEAIGINTTIPCETTVPVILEPDDDGSYTLSIHQGVAPCEADCRTLARVTLTGITGEQPRAFDITLAIDANGILHVEMIDSATGNKAQVKLAANSGLSQMDVDMLRRRQQSRPSRT